MSRVLSLAYLTVDGAGPVEHVDAAAAGGFTAAGLRILPPSHLTGAPAVVGNAVLLREIKRACARTGVGVFDTEVATLAADTDVATLLPMLETAAELGARFVQTVSEDPDRARAAGRFAVLCDAAAGFGLGVALEFMRFRCVRTIEDAAAIVAGAGRRNGGILVDALHLSRSGGDPTAVAAVPPERIAYLQLCDAPAEAPPPEALAQEARTNRLHPGDGALWLDALLGAVAADLPISVEVPCRADAGCTYGERAVRAGNAARRFLAATRHSPG